MIQVLLKLKRMQNIFIRYRSFFIMTLVVLGLTATIVLLSAFGLQSVLAQMESDRNRGDSDVSSFVSAVEAPSIATPIRAAEPPPINKKKPEFSKPGDVEKMFVGKNIGKGPAVVSHVDTGFVNDEDAANTISDVKIYFYVTNGSAQNNRLTLYTGIRKGTLSYLRIEGATGYRWEDGELVVAYISLPPNGATIVTITALPFLSNEALNLNLAPVLKNKAGSVIARGAAESKTLMGKSAGLVDTLRKNGPKQSVDQLVQKETLSADGESTTTTPTTTPEAVDESSFATTSEATTE